MSSKMIGKLIFNDELLQKDMNTITQFPHLEEEYAEFGIGTWKNHSLWNDDGDYKNTQYTEYATMAKITELGKKLPYITSVIKENFDITHLKMVRARNLIDGFVVPHKDFVELDKNKAKFLRVFIPLENNKDAYHSDEYGVFQMQKGEVWRLDASIVHAAANFGTDSRVHICLDFQFEDPNAPFESIFLDQKTATAVVPPTVPERSIYDNLDFKLKELATRINKDNLLETLVDLSKLHFQYDVNIIDCYDWLLSVSEQAGSDEILNKTKSLKKYMIEERTLGERFTFQDYHA